MEDNIMKLDYIGTNKCFVWKHEDYMDAGRKGVVAHDLEYAEDDIIGLVRLRIYENDKLGFAIQKYLVQVKISETCTLNFIAIFHLHFGSEMDVYYVEL